MAAIGAAAVLVIAVVAIVLRRGRRRRWQPAVAVPVSPAGEPDDRTRSRDRPGEPVRR
jgi:hypothetical protein